MEYIAKNGKSDYEIYLPAKRNKYLTFAAKELVYFIKEACGAELPVIYGLSGKKQPRCIVIRAVKNNSLGKDGYTLKTVNGSYFLTGGSVLGAVFAVYGFLSKAAGLKIYARDAFRLSRGDIPFINVEFTDVPDIPFRSLGIYPCHSEKAYPAPEEGRSRMRVRGMAEGWGLAMHSYFKILPPGKYKKAHPDFYSKGDGGINLCLSNGEMEEEFIRRVQEIIEQDPHAEYFMLGQEDNPHFCTCPECKAFIDSYGGFESALMTEFTSRVVNKLNAWLKEKHPERKITFCMFAYSRTMKPPVRFDKDKKAYVPVKDFDIPENLAVMFAPLYANCDKPYFSPENKTTFCSSYSSQDSFNTAEIFKGWRAVTKNIFLWTYSIDFTNYLVPFDFFGAAQENYKSYRNLGIKYIFEEANYQADVTNRTAMRAYVFSSLMWDTSLSVKELIEDFTFNYYGKAAYSAVSEYFSFVDEQVKRITEEMKRPMLYVRFDDYPDLSSPRYFPFEWLKEALALCEKAAGAAENETYRRRISAEGCPVKYLLILNYKDKLSHGEFARLKQDVVEMLKNNGLYSLTEGMNNDFIKTLAE